MDIVTQGILGSAFAQSFSSRKTLGLATVAGFLGGLAADADGFIRSQSDPLLAIQFHRHFTHSLLFIPIGALAVALLVWIALRRKEPFKTIYYFSFLGYATHALLDACTSYGTRLLWPFNSSRIAWDNVAIIDPFFTIPLLIAIIFVWKKKNNLVVRIILSLCIAYLLFGVVQRERAIDAAKNHALSQEQTPYEIQAKPTIGQLVLWKVIYKTKLESGEEFYNVRAVRLGLAPFFDTKIYKGESAPVLNIEKHFSNLDKNSVLYNDILRFADFSSNMVIIAPDNPNVVGDARYSLLPNQIRPLWGIIVDTAKPNEHVEFKNFRDAKGRDWHTLWAMIKGTHSVE